MHGNEGITSFLDMQRCRNPSVYMATGRMVAKEEGGPKGR